MRCQPCNRAMFKRGAQGSSWVWKCPKCNRTEKAPGDAKDIEAYRTRRQAKIKAKARQEAAEATGDAPEGEDAELWAMQRVMTQDFERDVGPRQQFYRRLYDDEPFRFAKLMDERKAALKREAATVAADKDEGVERSLELAESLLGEVANVDR